MATECFDHCGSGIRLITSKWMGGSVSRDDSTRSTLVDEKTKWIDTAEVIEKKGKIPVTGRYCTNRLLKDDYQLASKVLGSGMSGPVQLATSRGGDGEKCAVKSFKKHGLSEKRRGDLKNEVEIYLTLDHPHVARLLMVYEDEQEIHLVMEYMAGGELYDRLFQQRVYKEEMAAKTAKQMLLAVAYLHSHQIAHRDLKLENFLYERQDNDHLKLIDFGFAKFWDRSRNMTQACGSTHYVAPEVLGNSYTLKADLWSLGVISYMLLTGSPPFHGPDKEVLAKIRAGKVHWSSKFKRLSENAQDFVKALLVVNPNDRLDAQGALEHPWVKSLGTKNESPALDDDIKLSLRKFSKASAFRRAVLSMMAWSLNAEDRAQLRNEFLSFDTQNSGTIIHLQMKEILEKYYHIDTMEAEAMFNSMDTDHDDVIAYSEFLAAALQGRIKVHEDVLRRTFRKFDVDNCGRITADDLQGILGEHFEGTDAKELIKEADTNGDGMIEYDEFLNFFHSHEAHVDEEELLQAAPSPGPWTERSRTKRRQHTENLSLVIDRLLSEDVPVTSPLRRKAEKAQTWTARGSSF